MVCWVMHEVSCMKSWRLNKDAHYLAAACFVQPSTRVPCKCLRQNKWTWHILGGPLEIYGALPKQNWTFRIASFLKDSMRNFGWFQAAASYSWTSLFQFGNACHRCEISDFTSCLLLKKLTILTTDMWHIFVMCFGGQTHRMLNMLHSRANGMCVKKVKASKDPKHPKAVHEV